ncbi:MAG: transposase [Bdellovibrionales bacterium]|nr:transposase [Bdellovibrionales bacterium]
MPDARSGGLLHPPGKLYHLPFCHRSLQRQESPGVKGTSKRGSQFDIRPSRQELRLLSSRRSCHQSARTRKLEKIRRYIARPALSEERLSTNVRGEIIYRLKKPWSDGTLPSNSLPWSLWSASLPSFHDPKSI